MTILTVTEGRRGCGYRKEGGLYLRSDGIGRYCGALPIPLDVCPTCHAGIKQARGWTWVNLAALAAQRGCTIGQTGFDALGQPGVGPSDISCGDCPIADAKIQEVGLLWIGAQYYKTTAEFSSEAARMGLSRRITTIPKRFELGKTWVALAHSHAIKEIVTDKTGQKDALAMEGEGKFRYVAGIFHVFRPSRIEYVVRADDDEAKLEALEKRGITLVKVVKKEEAKAA